MKKVKTILISMAAFWLVCYVLMFLLNMIVFHSSSPMGGELSTQAIIHPTKAIVEVSASSNAALVPTSELSGKVDLFARPMLSASLVTVLAGLSVGCGYQITRLGCRGNSPLPK